MSIRPVFKFQNILLTLKRHKNESFELLYLSGNALGFLRPDEKFFHPSFFHRLLPTVEKPFFETIFKQLGQGESIEAPFLLDENVFQWVQIEGYIIAQQDNSYLVNAMFSAKRNCPLIDQAWLAEDFGKKKIYHSIDNIDKLDIGVWSDLANRVKLKFNFLEYSDIEKVIDSRENCELDIFKDYLLLKNTRLNGDYNLISTEFCREEVGISRIIEDGPNQWLYRSQPGTIFYEHELKNKNVKWSGAIFPVFGYSLEDFKKFDIFDWLELVHPEDRESIKTGFEVSFIPKNSIETQYRVMQRNGQYAYVQDTATTYFDSKSGKPLIVGTIRDISQLKNIEEDLRDYQFKLQELTGVVPGMVFMQKTNPKLKHEFIFISDGCEQLFEVRPETIMKNPSTILSMVHPEDVDYLKQKELESFSSHFKFEVYFRIITPSGKEKWVFGTSDRVKNYQNDSIWAGVYIDVTITKNKEEEAKQNFLKYETIFDESPMAILQFDRNLVITEVNKTLLRKLKLPDKKTITGKNITEFTNDPNVLKVFEDATKVGKSKFEGQYKLSMDDSKFYSKISAVEIGNGLSYQAIIEDITEKEFVQTLLNQVAELTDLYPNKNFFDEIVKLLTKRLRIKYCYIGELNKSKEKIDIISMSNNGDLMDSFSFPIKGSVIESTLLEDPLRVKIINKEVRRIFPEDLTLNKLHIEFYTGIKIQGYYGDTIGFLVMMDSNPLFDVKGFDDLFIILRDRIGAELRRLRYEKELIDTNKMQKTILNGTEYAVFSIDQNMEINLINDNTLSIFDLKDKRQLLDTILFHQNVSVSLREIIQNPKNSNISSNYYILPLQNEETRELKISISSVTYGDEEDLNYVIFVVDITKRTASEKKLLESEQLYRSIAENFPKGTVDVLDTNLNYIYTDGKEYQINGIDPKTLIGTNYLDKFEGEILEKVKSEIQKVLLGEMISYELVYNNENYLKSGVPLVNNKGEIDRILLVRQNISELKDFEIEREKLIKDLKSHNEELLRFAYIVSHNLRAPIVNISLLIDLYDEGEPDSPENREVIDNLKISANLLNSTLRDLIEVVSIKKQKIPKVEVIDFRMLINNIEKSLFKQLKESGTIIHKDFSELQEINYIYAHLENFLLNFMTNAIKYKHPDRVPEIRIKTYTQREYCVISFSDNGIGFDIERYRDRLFGLYQRFHNHVEGKGLGLYLVREQIRAHDGNIEISSVVGEGTKVIIYLKNMKLPVNGNGEE